MACPQEGAATEGAPAGRSARPLWTWLLPVGLLCGLVILFFGPILASRGELYGSDAIFYFVPLKQFIHESVNEGGCLPFWNPYVFSGIPLISNIQASMFYPFGVLYYLLPPDSAYTWSILLHCLIGGFSMLALMRSLGLSILPSSVSSIVFCFNGFFLGHLFAGHLTFVQSYVWIPMVFLFVHRFCVSLRARHGAAAGVLLGIQLLGGFPQIAFYTVLAVLAYGGFRAVELLWMSAWRKAAFLVLGLGCVLAIGASLAAMQLLPTWEFSALSTRSGGLSYDFATYDSLHPKELLSFLLPDLYGSAVDGTYWRTPDVWHYWETCGYVGILPLFLVFIGRQNGERTGTRWFFALLIVAALFLALGKHNPLYFWIAQLPGFRSFRIPAQIIFLYVFGMAVLAGFGLEGMRRGGWRFHQSGLLLWLPAFFVLMLSLIGIQLFSTEFFLGLFRWLAASGVTHANLEALGGRTWTGILRGAVLFVSCVAILAARRSGRLSWAATAALCVFLVITDLYLFGHDFIRPHDYDQTMAKANLVSHLPNNPAEGRVITLRDSFESNDSMRYQFPSILGYDPLLLRRYVYWIQSSQGLAQNDHVVNLVAVRRPEDKLIKLLHPKWLVAENNVVPLNNDFPYALFVAGHVLRSGEDALQEIRGRDFDPTRTVVLESRSDASLVEKNGSARVHGTFEVKSYENEQIRFGVSVNQPAYMVLSEIYYPGWEAEVDGVEVPILQGNYLFRVVPLEAGTHEVELTFVSWPFRIGAGISLIALLLVAGAFLLDCRRKTPPQ